MWACGFLRWKLRGSYYVSRPNIDSFTVVHSFTVVSPGTPLIETITGCPQIHGADSLGDLDPPLPISSRPVHAVSGVEQLLWTLREAPGPITIIALAPLSNIATCVVTDG